MTSAAVSAAETVEFGEEKAVTCEMVACLSRKISFREQPTHLETRRFFQDQLKHNFCYNSNSRSACFQ